MRPARLGLCLPLLGLLLLGLLLLASHPASAMRFAYSSTGGAGLLAASGKVELGDGERLRAALQAVPAGARLAGLSLNSPGGDLEEGLRLAADIHDAQLHTLVGDGATCASACFILFAAGRQRSASTTALIGVHSVSYRGSDNPDAQAMTVRMARRLAEYGVPDAILGKMVTAQPSQIWWLTRSELEAMRVDMDVQRAAALPGIEALPAPGGWIPDHPPSPGFRIEPAARGYQMAPAAGGFRVWRPG